MRRTKVFAVLCLAFLVVCCGLPFAFATTSLTYNSAAYGSEDIKLTTISPSANSSVSGAGTTFNASVTGYLREVDFRVTKLSTPNFVVRAYLFAATTPYDQKTSVPIGYPLAASANVSTADITTGLKAFVFDGTFQIVAKNCYAVVLEALPEQQFFGLGTVISSTKCVSIQSGSNYAGGNATCFTSGGWSVANLGGVGYDLYCNVYVSDVSSGGSPADGGSSSILTNVDWTGGVSWLAVLALICIPTFILGVYMRGGKWGFLIGLAIGTGLSYLVFPLLVPIWLVVLVGIGLGAAFLSSVRSGG